MTNYSNYETYFKNFNENNIENIIKNIQYFWKNWIDIKNFSKQIINIFLNIEYWLINNNDNNNDNNKYHYNNNDNNSNKIKYSKELYTSLNKVYNKYEKAKKWLIDNWILLYNWKMLFEHCLNYNWRWANKIDFSYDDISEYPLLNFSFYFCWNRVINNLWIDNIIKIIFDNYVYTKHNNIKNNVLTKLNYSIVKNDNQIIEDELKNLFNDNKYDVKNANDINNMNDINRKLLYEITNSMFKSIIQILKENKKNILKLNDTYIKNNESNEYSSLYKYDINKKEKFINVTFDFDYFNLHNFLNERFFNILNIIANDKNIQEKIFNNIEFEWNDTQEYPIIIKFIDIYKKNISIIKIIFNSLIQLLKKFLDNNNIEELYKIYNNEEKYLQYLSEIWDIMESKKINIYYQNKDLSDISLNLKIYY